MQGYRLPRWDALTNTAVAARRTLPTESRKRGSRRGGGDTCIPRRPLAAGPTPAYIHPQVLPLPSSTSFSPAHPSSSFIPLLFAHWLSSDSSCHRFQVNFALTASYYIIYMFLVPFVNFISSWQRFLCSLYLSRRISRGPFRFTTCSNTFYSTYPSLYFSFSHFSLWLLAVRLFELLSCISCYLRSLPCRFFLVLSWQRAVIATAATARMYVHIYKDWRALHASRNWDSVDTVRRCPNISYIPNKVRVPSLVFISKLLIFYKAPEKTCNLGKLYLIR